MKKGKCWVWNGPKNGGGYGIIRVGGRYIGAHRFIYEALNGKIPAGMFICHHCDNPPCFNPRHLFMGTIADNTRDMIEKGRGVNPVGEKHGKSKLKNERVSMILALRKNKLSYSKITKMTKVPKSTIQDIVHGRTWSHLSSIRQEER